MKPNNVSTFQLIGVTAAVDLQLLLEKRVVRTVLHNTSGAANVLISDATDLENECAVYTSPRKTVRGGCDNLHG